MNRLILIKLFIIAIIVGPNGVTTFVLMEDDPECEFLRTYKLVSTRASGLQSSNL